MEVASQYAQYQLVAVTLLARCRRLLKAAGSLPRTLHLPLFE